MEETQPTQPPAEMPSQFVSPTQASPMQPEDTAASEQTARSGVPMIGVVIALVLFLGFGALAFAAANMGKGNVFSQLSAYIPFEKIPLISALTKSSEQLLRDVIPATTKFSMMKKYGGSEWQGRVLVTGEATQPETQQKVSLDLHVNGKTAVNGNLDQMKSEYALGGTVASGVMKIDLGESGIEFDSLMPNTNDVYFSLQLSDEMKTSLAPYLTQVDSSLSSLTALGMPALTSNDLFNTYWKFDTKAYMKMMNELTGQTAEEVDYDFNKYQQAIEELMNEIGPDFQKMYASTLGNFSRYARVRDYGRQSVNGSPAIVVGLEISNDNVPPVVAEFAEGMTVLVKKHPAAFQKFCETISSNEITKKECATEFSQEKLDEVTLTVDDKKELEDSMRELLTNLTINTLKFYISPVNNTLLKSEIGVMVSEQGLAALSSGSGYSWSKFEVSMESEELSRGKSLTVEVPKDSKDLVQLIRQFMDAQTKMMQQTTIPTIGKTPKLGTTTPALPPGLEDQLDAGQYQQLMQLYGQ